MKADGGTKMEDFKCNKKWKRVYSKKMKITQSTQGSSESKDLPRKVEQKSLEHQEVRENMKSVSLDTPRQKRKTNPKTDEGTRKRKPENAAIGLKQSPQRRTKATCSRSKERKD